MAFFKFRKAGDEPAGTREQPESIEAMRKRARHRLIGAGVLVLIGVIGFPLLFDTQPRPIAVDIPIEIPDRNKAKPLSAPAPAVTQAPAPQEKVAAAPVPVPTPATVTPPPARAESAPAKPEIKPEPKAESKAPAKPADAKPTEAKSASKPDDGAKAQALLEGKGADSAAAKGRFVVQVGAFADGARAREARLKLEKAGLKTYTHEAETKEGKRIRVRVGPFDTRAEADKAADKIKGLDLPAAILTL